MIGILDYDAGNIKSVQNALDRLGQTYFVSDQPSRLEKAEKIIFPGVGHAAPAMDILKAKKLDRFLRQCEKPVLGICLGMQLFLDFSEEGETECLGIIPGKVEKFDAQKVPKIPHMGWNRASINNEELVMSNKENFFSKNQKLKTNNYFYFVHSYFVPISAFTSAETQFGDQKFSSVIRYKNFLGMQFHPEKSGKVGEEVLKEFLNGM